MHSGNKFITGLAGETCTNDIGGEQRCAWLANGYASPQREVGFRMSPCGKAAPLVRSSRRSISRIPVGGKFQVAVVAYGRPPQRRQRAAVRVDRAPACCRAAQARGSGNLLCRVDCHAAPEIVRRPVSARGGAFPFSSSGTSTCQRSLTETAVDRPESRDPSSPRRCPHAPVAACYRGSAGACSAAVALTSSAAMAGAGDGRAGPAFSTSPGWTFRGPDCSISLLISASRLVAQPASSEQSKRARGVDTRMIISAARLISPHDSASRNPGEQPYASACVGYVSRRLLSVKRSWS